MTMRLQWRTRLLRRLNPTTLPSRLRKRRPSGRTISRADLTLVCDAKRPLVSPGGLFRGCAEPFVAKFVQPSERSPQRPCYPPRAKRGPVREYFKMAEERDDDQF